MQTLPEAQQEFLRFRDHGDPSALTRVFDLVAQRLLLVASHVANRRQPPEDLVQETFLTAIQRADQYDGERPLEPWLVGILVNVTRNDRRRRARELSGMELEPTPDPRQPSETAIEREVAAALNQAIDGLPVPQREVMTLNLVHGMTPTEIAHATSRSLGTVKSWIHRSLGVIRRRLPASMAMSFGTMLRGMDDLPRVREAIATAAQQATVATGGVVTAPIASNLTKACLVAGAVMLASVPIFLLWDGTTIAVSSHEQSASVSAITNPLRQQTTATAVGSEAPQRDDTTPEPGVSTVTLIGDFAGQPFAWSGHISPHARRSEGSSIETAVPDHWLRRLPFETNSAGQREITGVPFGDYGLQPNRGDYLPFTVDGPQTTIVVPMKGGVEVAGRAVDARGHGLAGAEIWSTLPGSLDHRLRLAVCDERGRFCAPAVTPGRYLTASFAGLRPSRLHPITVSGDPGEVDLVLDESANFVDISVVDQTGNPVAGAALQLGNCLLKPPAKPNSKVRQLRQPWLGRTDANGRATCGEMAVGHGAFLFVHAPDMVPVRHEVRPIAGRQTVRIELIRGARCHGSLTNAPGEVIDAVVRAIVMDERIGRSTPDWFWPICFSRGGRFTLSGIPVGPVVLQATSQHDGRAESERRMVDGEQLEWSPQLGQGGRITGTAMTGAGAVIKGFVQALATMSAPVSAPIRDDGTFELEGLRDRIFELVVTPTDDGESFILHREYGVRIGAEVDLVVADSRTPSAVLQGRFTRLDATGASLFDARSGKSLFTDVDDEGGFVFPAVPPGSYHLVAGRNAILTRHDVDLVANDFVDVGITDAMPRTPVTVQLLDAHEPTKTANLIIMTDRCGPMLGFARLDGDPVKLLLPPGALRLCIAQNGIWLTQRRVVVGNEPLSLSLTPEAGDPVLFSARTETPRIHLRAIFEIEGSDGLRRYSSRRPNNYAAHRSVGLRCVLPPGEYTVRAFTADGARAETAVTLPLKSGAMLPPLILR